MLGANFFRNRRARIALAIAGAALVALATWIRLGPLPSGFLDRKRFVSTRVLDRNGEVLYESLSEGGTRADWIDASEIPERLVDATLAAEDHRFFSHPGIDPIAVARATLRNIRHVTVVEGGSTISQQVAKQIMLAHGGSRSRGLGAKVRETIYALRLEHRLTKREILALYLNLAPYGNQFVGVRRASRGYFNREPAMLTLAQAAFLAGLPQRPSAYDPYRRFERASARQTSVLDRIARLELASASSLDEARKEEIRLVRENPEFIAPHFVVRLLAGNPRSETIHATLDAPLQRSVRGVIRSFKPTLDKHAAHNVAVVVLDNRTGEWLAWEGSGDYFDTEHGGAIDGVITPRQPGSALKPFTYALAFDEGWTPASVLADVPSHFPTREEGVLYSPRNYDGRYHGPLRARLALGGSQNVPAVVLASEVGAPSVARLLRRAGMTTFDKTAEHYGLGVTLGNAEVRLDELVAGYAAFARGGETVTPRFVRTRTGAGLEVAGERIMSRRAAFWITDILSDHDARSWTFGQRSSLDFAFQAAVKTGTSQAYRDNWTIGYTRAITVGVWVGNFDRTPLRNSSGVTGAAPIFRAVMLAALERVEGRVPADADPRIVEETPDLERRNICALSGLEATERCPAKAREWLPKGVGRESCWWHHTDDGETIVVWPPEYQAWARGEGLLRQRASRIAVPSTDAQRAMGRSTRSRPARALAITSPPSGATYLIDPTLRREFQSLPLRVTVSGNDRRVEWLIDGEPYGTTRSDASLDWPLTPGTHVFRATDGRAADEALIVVK